MPDDHAGQPGEQWTMFFKDPSGNALEFKAMTTPQNLFAKYYVSQQAVLCRVIESRFTATKAAKQALWQNKDLVERLRQCRTCVTMLCYRLGA